jgi:hypothetical protein
MIYGVKNTPKYESVIQKMIIFTNYDIVYDVHCVIYDKFVRVIDKYIEEYDISEYETYESYEPDIRLIANTYVGINCYHHEFISQKSFLSIEYPFLSFTHRNRDVEEILYNPTVHFSPEVLDTHWSVILGYEIRDNKSEEELDIIINNFDKKRISDIMYNLDCTVIGIIIANGTFHDIKTLKRGFNVLDYDTKSILDRINSYELIKVSGMPLLAVDFY